MRMEEKEERRVDGEVRGADSTEMDATLARVFERRERHRERSIFFRIGVVVAGGAVSLFAALLSILTPEFGLPLLLFGLRLLALEFDWAARLYTRVAKVAKKVAGSLRRLWPKSKVGVALVILALVAVAAFVIFV
ncbi:MAG: hypothetical protein ACR2N0_08625 [Rubrobacteraceae bacterium]